MAAVVEAKSLSSLTTIASNPPLYPRNPTQQKQDPLVLYISRVPGSRDIFFTPVKPREKVVSAEDVQSSFYYVHIDRPEDERLSQLATDPHLEDGNANQDNSVQVQIHRKALPPSAPDAIQAQAVGAPTPNHMISPLSERAVDLNRRNVDAARILRRPVASDIAFHGRGHSTSSVSATLTNGLGTNESFEGSTEVSLEMRARTGLPARKSVPSVHPKPVGPRSNPTDTTSRTGFGNDLRNAENVSPSMSLVGAHIGHANASEADSQDSKAARNSLTLIRRDPTSGAQWNVAKIKDSQIVQESSTRAISPTAAYRARQKGGPIDIDILNPGYGKFVSDAEDHDRGRHVAPKPSNVFFRRCLHNEGFEPSRGGFSHKKSVSADAGQHSTLFADSNYDFRDSLRPSSSADPFHAPDVSAETNRQRLSRNRYLFLSPWGGRCEFFTGGAAKSLKCMHFIHNGTVAGSNPDPVTVSELRFNLYVSNSSGRPKSRGNGTFTKSSSSLPFSSHTRHSSSWTAETAYEEEHDSVKAMSPPPDKLDLSLGQELAGGGFGGKQAKLGKLIIQDEGFKMMDLLVAANVGLWFRAYDRFDKS